MQELSDEKKIHFWCLKKKIFGWVRLVNSVQLHELNLT